MNYYKISKDLWSCVSRFDTLEEAQAFADSLGTGYLVEYVGPYEPPSLQDRLQMDLTFGQQLVFIFVEDIQLDVSLNSLAMDQVININIISETVCFAERVVAHACNLVDIE